MLADRQTDRQTDTQRDMLIIYSHAESGETMRPQHRSDGIPLSSVAAAGAATGDTQFLVTSLDGVSVFTVADDVSKPDTNEASAEK